MPQVELGLKLRGIASACIDISDGLASDLGHILRQSHVGACLDWEKLPLSDAVKSYIKATNDASMPLISGDDYELCFTISPEFVHRVPENCTQIGVIETTAGLRLTKFGQTETLNSKGYEHFS
jgi:thiamine-monophosphate kinase